MRLYKNPDQYQPWDPETGQLRYLVAEVDARDRPTGTYWSPTDGEVRPTLRRMRWKDATREYRVVWHGGMHSLSWVRLT
jgi:hypothetical protein